MSGLSSPQPVVEVAKEFMLSSHPLTVEANLDKAVSLVMGMSRSHPFMRSIDQSLNLYNRDLLRRITTESRSELTYPLLTDPTRRLGKSKFLVRNDGENGSRKGSMLRLAHFLTISSSAGCYHLPVCQCRVQVYRG